MTGWKYYKPLVLSGSGGEETDINYRVSVTFNSNMQADFADIRFTDSDNVTLLEQYRESYIESDSAVFWIKVPSVSAGGKTIRMWYGNAEVSLKSDGEATFPLFDDFSGDNGDPPDATKWTNVGSNIIQDNTLKMHCEGGSDNKVNSLTESYGVCYGIIASIKNTSTMKEPFRSIGFTKYPENNIDICYIFRGDGSVSRFQSTGAQENIPLISLNDWHKVELRRVSDTQTLCYMDGTKYTLNGDSNTYERGCGMTLYTVYMPTNDSLWINWILVYKIHSTISDTFPSLGDEVSVGLTGRDWLFAYQNDVTDWGTPVKALSGDQILPSTFGPLVSSAAINPDKCCGFSWNKYVYKGRILSEQTIKMPLRYSGRHFSFIAQVMGKDTVTGSGVYTHLFELLDSVDGSGLFGTLYAYLGRSGSKQIVEYPSSKPFYFSIDGPEYGGYLSLTVRLISDTTNYNTDALMTTSDFDSVDHILFDSDLPKIIPFGSLRVRVNDFGDGALDTVDQVKPVGIKYEVERPQVRDWVARGSLDDAWKTDEPKETQISVERLTLVFPDLNTLTHLEKYKDQEIRKADLYMQYNSDLNLLIEFPALFPVVPDANCLGQSRISHPVGFVPLEVLSAPTGMTLTKWNIKIKDGNANAYQ